MTYDSNNARLLDQIAKLEDQRANLLQLLNGELGKTLLSEEDIADALKGQAQSKIMSAFIELVRARSRDWGGLLRSTTATEREAAMAAGAVAVLDELIAEIARRL